MAPQTMFAKIRNHHRRSGSTPTSPQYPSTNEPPDRLAAHVHSPSYSTASATASPRLDSPVSPLPPILPPIPRVASKHEPQHESHREAQHEPTAEPHTEVHRDLVEEAPQQDMEFSFDINFSTHETPLLPPIPRLTSQQEPKSPGHTTRSPHASNPPPDQREGRVPDPPRLMKSIPSSKAPATLSRASTSFAEFSSSFMRPARSRAEPQQPSTAPPTSALSHFPETSRTGSDQRGPTPSSSMSSLQKAASSTSVAPDGSPASSRSGHGSTSNAVPSRTSKSRLNMLNPVSLLMRRRNSRAFEDTADGRLVPPRMMDVPAMDLPTNYDPRIRGKGVHNFDDSSRTQRNSSATDTIDVEGASPGLRQHLGSPSPVAQNAGRSDVTGQDPSSEKEHTPIFVENFDDDGDQAPTGATAVQRESLANPEFLKRMSRQLDFDSIDFSVPTGPKRSSADQTHNATSNPPTAARSSKTTDSSSVRHSSDQSTVRSSISNETRATSPPPSPPPEPSTQSATLQPPFAAVQPLQHLSSTASRNSRFSFQLNSDHCIEQEKALEDKHKQKQALKASRLSVADSRFDELVDEEDDVDYDDMGEGGYQEEAIPGVNASDEDEPVGLGNQRLSTFGMPSMTTQASSQSLCTDQDGPDVSPPEASGLMYQHQNADVHQQQSQDGHDQDQSSSDRTMTKSTVVSDDMYFDDGMIDAPTQGGQSHYDESLLDSPTDGQTKPHSYLNKSAGMQSTHSGLVGLGLQAEVDPMGALDLGETHLTRIGEDNHSGELATDQGNNNTQAAALSHSSSLTAYHNALASAASRAAKSGKFDRQGSIATASSSYSNDQENASGFVDEDWGDDDPQDFDDLAEADEDPMIAAANAEVLASEDADFYGQEFGFYGNANGQKAEAYNGGYFGQQNMLGASLHNRKNDPNLTPITERSEYSTRNSFIGSTPWGPPSMSAREPTAMSPGLKDIAASMGMDDEDMTLGQLLRLRKVAFEGSGSGPQSAQESSNSKDSSPTSASNSAALPFRMSPMMSAGGYGSVYDHQRRPSELELADVREAPEDEENADTPISGIDSPISPTVTIATATAVAVPQASGQAKRHGSAEIYAQEYSDVVSGSPHASSRMAHSPASASTSATALQAPAVPGRSSPPLLKSPPLPRSPGQEFSPKVISPALRSAPPTASTFSPVSSSPFSATASPRTTSSSPIPSPPITMMQKFANRPPPDAYRKAWEPSQRMSLSTGRQMSETSNETSGGNAQTGAGSAVSGTTSVAYVREVGEDGREQWYLERRRKQSNGDLVVVGREIVQDGSI